MRFLYSRHLEHFLAVCEAQSLRRAAVSCGVTQPALTKSVKVLEAALGASLFERRAEGVQPTAAAQLLRRHALQIVNSARCIDMEIRMLRDGEGGALRIGCGVVWNATRGPEIVADLRRQFPRLDVTVQGGISAQLTPKLLDGELDVVIASLPQHPLPAGFSTVELPSTEMVVFARAGHALARRRRAIDMGELSRCDLVGFAEDSVWQRQTAAMFAAHNLPEPPVLLKSTSPETLLATVAASDSMAILSALLSARAASYGLKRVRTAQALWSIRMGISYRTQLAEFAPLQALLAATAPA